MKDRVEDIRDEAAKFAGSLWGLSVWWCYLLCSLVCLYLGNILMNGFCGVLYSIYR